MNNIDYFFNPRSVAVIGASREPRKFGRIIMENFVKRFKGEVFPVNPGTGKVMNRTCYDSVKDIPHEVDLAVIVIPAKYVEGVLEECSVKGVKAVVVISGGFSEIGEKKREDRLLKTAKKYGMRLMGPNCIGVFDAYSHVDTLFSPMYRQDRPFKGDISFISQSGAYGTAIMDLGAAENMGISKFISIGNRADVNEIDVLRYLKDDENTKVIVMYLEGTEDGREFYNVLKEVTKVKPVIAMKAGTTDEGGKATLSHTGSLAGSSEIFSGMLKQAGGIEADSSEELFDFARAFSYAPLPKGDRIQIVTNAGGFGVIATDSVIKNRLRLAEMSQKTREEIKGYVPSYATVKNPIDLVGDADSRRYEKVLEAVMGDDAVDAVFVIMLLQLSSLESDIVDVLISIGSEFPDKPLLVCTTGGEFTHVHTKMMEKIYIPTYPTPERGIEALRRLTEYAGYRRDHQIRPLTSTRISR